MMLELDDNVYVRPILSPSESFIGIVAPHHDFFGGSCFNRVEVDSVLESFLNLIPEGL